MFSARRVSSYKISKKLCFSCRCLPRNSSNSTASAEQRSPATPPPSLPSDSIFSKTAGSAWDHVFEDLPEVPPLAPSSSIPHRYHAASSQSPSAAGRARRQAMTAREINAFDEMFNMIFSAVSEQKTNSKPSLPGAKVDPLTSAGIGRGPRTGPLVDLFGKLKRDSKKIKWTSQQDEELDRKKEEMDLCDTDQQLLEWATREVFGESQRYEEAAREAISKNSSISPTASFSDLSSSSSPSPASLSSPSPRNSLPENLHLLQPATYPHVIAYLMQSFRNKYSDPHLALSIFSHARHLSIPSYVFGCTTPAYNELIITLWTCFQDLKGVCEALEEMTINGVEFDGKTRKTIESMRREVGKRHILGEEGGDRGLLGVANGNDATWSIMNRIEELMLDELPKKSKHQISAFSSSSHSSSGHKSFDSWKSSALNPKADGWEFDHWSSRKTNARPKRPLNDIHRSKTDGSSDWVDLGSAEDKFAFH